MYRNSQLQRLAWHHLARLACTAISRHELLGGLGGDVRIRESVGFGVYL
jgi:hypothetical protein